MKQKLKKIKKPKENYWIQDELCPGYDDLPKFQDCGLRIVAVESLNCEATEKEVKKKKSTISLVKTNRRLMKSNEALTIALNRLDDSFKTGDEEKKILEKKFEQLKEELTVGAQTMKLLLNAKNEAEIEILILKNQNKELKTQCQSMKTYSRKQTARKSTTYHRKVSDTGTQTINDEYQPAKLSSKQMTLFRSYQHEYKRRLKNKI